MEFAWGLNGGFTIVVTQAFGAKDQRKVRKSIAGMILLNGIIGSLLTLVTLFFLRPLMSLLHVPEDIFAQAYAYVAVIVGGLLATICYLITREGSSRA